MSRRRWNRIGLSLALTWAAILSAPPGCGRADDPAVDQTPTLPTQSQPHPHTQTSPPPDNQTAPRLVTLAPALTQLLTQLDYGDHIVGVAQYDTLAPPAARVIGTYYDVNVEALLTVRPTHVLTLTSLSEPPAVLRDLAAQGRFILLTFDYPDSLTEVADLIAPPPAPPPEGDEIPAATTPHRLSLAQVFPQSNARQLRENLLTRMQALRRLTQTASANTPHAQLPRVLLLIGTHPLMASGPHTVLDDMLHYAGGRNAVADATVGAPTLSQERLIGIDPDVILLFDPRGQPLRGVADDPRLAELRGLPLRAVQNQRIHLIDDPLAVLPGTSLTRVAAAMAKLIHPELAPDIERTMSIAPPPPASSTSTPAMSSKPSS